MQLRCLSGWGEDVSGEVLERVEFKLHRSFQNNRIGGVFFGFKTFLSGVGSCVHWCYGSNTLQLCFHEAFITVV